MEANEYDEIIENLNSSEIPDEIKETVLAMLDSKAEKVVVLKIGKFSDVTDYLVICNGNGDRHNGAISDEVQKRLKKKIKKKSYGIEGETNAQWILIDYADFIVHIFTKDNRVRYSLEKLWMDGKRYSFYKD
jgi:ribosome-associated protein